MEIEKQVVYLELAKRLKELGVKQESLFYWCLNIKKEYVVRHLEDSILGVRMICSAFTVAELGEMLPDWVSINPTHYRPNVQRGWYCKDMQEDIQPTFAFNEADARAKMLIYLIENKLIKAQTTEGKIE